MEGGMPMVPNIHKKPGLETKTEPGVIKLIEINRDFLNGRLENCKKELGVKEAETEEGKIAYFQVYLLQVLLADGIANLKEAETILKEQPVIPFSAEAFEKARKEVEYWATEGKEREEGGNVKKMEISSFITLNESNRESLEQDLQRYDERLQKGYDRDTSYKIAIVKGLLEEGGRTLPIDRIRLEERTEANILVNKSPEQKGNFEFSENIFNNAWMVIKNSAERGGIGNIRRPDSNLEKAA